MRASYGFEGGFEDGFGGGGKMSRSDLRLPDLRSCLRSDCPGQGALWNLRWLVFSFAVLSLAASSALAQPGAPLTCVAPLQGRAPLRSEGLAERIEDIAIYCTGGVPTPAG